MSAVSRPTIDRNLEYNKFAERKHNLAVGLNITLEKKIIDATRYEEKGRSGQYQLTYYSEGEGSSKNKKHGYFEVVKLTLSKLSSDNKIEEFISLNYENSELYTSYRDKDFWIEYSGTDVEKLRKKFAAFKNISPDTLKGRILSEFARLGENAVKTAGMDIVLYYTLTTPLEGIEDLMYQIILDDYNKPLVVSEDKKYRATEVTEKPVIPERPPAPEKSQVEKPSLERAPIQETKKPPAATPMAVHAEEPQEEGLKLLYEKKYEEAVEYYKKKAKDSPKDPEGWFGLSACLFLTGEIKKCTLYYNKCIENKPNFNISKRLLKLSGNEFENLYNLAERLQIIELYDEARKYLEYLEKQNLPDDLQRKLRILQKKSSEEATET